MNKTSVDSIGFTRKRDLGCKDKKIDSKNQLHSFIAYANISLLETKKPDKRMNAHSIL